MSKEIKSEVLKEVYWNNWQSVVDVYLGKIIIDNFKINHLQKSIILMKECETKNRERWKSSKLEDTIFTVFYFDYIKKTVKNVAKEK